MTFEIPGSSGHFVATAHLRLEAEISAAEVISNSILPEDTKCSGCGLNALNSAVEAFRRAFTDGEHKPRQNPIQTIVQQACSIVF
jgi:hypothetical protein